MFFAQNNIALHVFFLWKINCKLVPSFNCRHTTNGDKLSHFWSYEIYTKIVPKNTQTSYPGITIKDRLRKTDINGEKLFR